MPLDDHSCQNEIVEPESLQSGGGPVINNGGNVVGRKWTCVSQPMKEQIFSDADRTLGGACRISRFLAQSHALAADTPLVGKVFPPVVLRVVRLPLRKVSC